jgi:alpha-beta hydrolase superfamily lysophospholipase
MTRPWRALALAACATATLAHAQPTVKCPEPAPDDAKCYGTTDANGALVLFVVPARWNGVLVVHARDGPATKPPNPELNADDLNRWNAFVRAEYAWVDTTYRRAGYGVRDAVEDVENARKLFPASLKPPRRTLLHGEGWGALVAARAIEIHPKSFDGALFTSGELAGATRSEDYRLDLRMIYQFYCRNLPRPDEPQYPPWMGLPPGSKLTSADVRARFNECTGSNLPTPQRTPAQRAALAAILAASRVPERTLPTQLARATLVIGDLVNRVLGGRNPFSNEGVEYRGSPDDRALNAGVPRFAADPGARADLAADADPTGRIAIPVFTLHAIGDPYTFVENETVYRATLERAGTAANLVQVYTDEAEHSSLSSAEYMAALDSLNAWIEHARKPTAAEVQVACKPYIARFDEPCRIKPDYQPGAWEARVYPRKP